jgi:hypothetical protein
MSSRAITPGCTQVLYDHSGLYTCQRVIYTVSTDRESKLSDICTVQNDHKALVYIRALYPAAHLYTGHVFSAVQGPLPCYSRVVLELDWRLGLQHYGTRVTYTHTRTRVTYTYTRTRVTYTYTRTHIIHTHGYTHVHTDTHAWACLETVKSIFLLAVSSASVYVFIYMLAYSSKTRPN